MHFGEKLIKLRKENGMSQEELAAKIPVSRQAISRWENGEALPDAENILKISKLFSVSTDYLLHDSYESDRDIPIVKETASEAKLEQERHSTFVLLLGGLALFAILMLAGLYSQAAWLLLAGIIGQVVFVIAFEVTFVKYRGLPDAKAWKRRFYRRGIWLLNVFPAYAVPTALFSFYPRGYYSLVLDVCCIAFYFLVCFAVHFGLKSKRF